MAPRTQSRQELSSKLKKGCDRVSQQLILRKEVSQEQCTALTGSAYARDRPGTIFPPGPGPGIGARTGGRGRRREDRANHEKRCICVSAAITRIIKTYDLLDYSRNVNTSFFMICAISPFPAPVSRQGRGDRANHEKTKYLRFGGNLANHKNI